MTPCCLVDGVTFLKAVILLYYWNGRRVRFGSEMVQTTYTFCGFHDVNSSTLSVPIRHCCMPACLAHSRTTKTLTLLDAAVGTTHLYVFHRTWMSHGAVDGYLIGLVYDDASIDKKLWKFRRGFLLPSSRSKLYKKT